MDVRCIEDGGREHYLLRYLEYLKLYFTKTDKAYRTGSLEPPFPFISTYNEQLTNYNIRFTITMTVRHDI